MHNSLKRNFAHVACFCHYEIAMSHVDFKIYPCGILLYSLYLSCHVANGLGHVSNLINGLVTMLILVIQPGGYSVRHDTRLLKKKKGGGAVLFILYRILRELLVFSSNILHYLTIIYIQICS